MRSTIIKVEKTKILPEDSVNSSPLVCSEEKSGNPIVTRYPSFSRLAGVNILSALFHDNTLVCFTSETLFIPCLACCHSVSRFLVGFLLISCCRNEKGFWQCPCRPRRDRPSESAKTSTTNISTLNHVSQRSTYISIYSFDHDCFNCKRSITPNVLVTKSTRRLVVTSCVAFRTPKIVFLTFILCK